MKVYMDKQGNLSVWFFAPYWWECENRYGVWVSYQAPESFGLECLGDL